jgi:hypothetical protein
MMGFLSRVGLVRRAMVAGMFGVAFALLGCVFTAVPALALPEGRVYEMVSPPYKAGYGVRQIKAVAPNGESVAFYSQGTFAGAPSGLTPIDYLAHRTATGWSTSSLVPPASLLPSVSVQDVSSTLESSVALGKPGPNREAAFFENSGQEFLTHESGIPDNVFNWERAGAPLETVTSEGGNALYDGASPDLCHLFVHGKDAPPLSDEALEAKGGIDLAYEDNRGCGGEKPGIGVVGLNDAGKLINRSCEAVIGDSGLYGGSAENQFNAVAGDGRVVFFTTGVETKGGGCSSDYQVFARLGGERTIEVSRPLTVAPGEECSEVPCAGSEKRVPTAFAGASEDGSLAYFTTTASLAQGDKDTGSDLYLARIGCSGGGEGCAVSERVVTSLVQVSHDGGGVAEVQGVVRVAPDGSRVYFVARGVLAGANLEGGSPVLGADNLYVYDAGSESVRFVAELCSGPGVSGPGGSLRDGGVGDRSCPADLEGGGEGSRNDVGLWVRSAEVQTAGSAGEYLVFSSFGRLTRDDTDNARDVYRYDANTRSLVRVSVGEAGFDANGDRNDGDEPPKINEQGETEPGTVQAADATIIQGALGGSVLSQYDMGSRAVSEDGSTIAFESSEPLSPGAVNGLSNVYEWHEGSVSLISSGSGQEPVEDAVISPSGNDIFFVTSQALVPEDVDSAPDVYDARIGGGFPVAPAPPEECSGDACQGPLTNPVPLLVPGSVSQAPGENFPVPSPAQPVAVKSKTKSKPVKCRKGFVEKNGRCIKKKPKAKKAGVDRRVK